mmetsp:Transcript_6178/g.28331  ORF Transcript_6178/g.28331 Transcript_6178/m.28331 type:complete len:576 (+) Transcript_6178:96-1823(+)
MRTSADPARGGRRPGERRASRRRRGNGDLLRDDGRRASRREEEGVGILDLPRRRDRRRRLLLARTDVHVRRRLPRRGRAQPPPPHLRRVPEHGELRLRHRCHRGCPPPPRGVQHRPRRPDRRRQVPDNRRHAARRPSRRAHRRAVRGQNRAPVVHPRRQRRVPPRGGAHVHRRDPDAAHGGAARRRSRRGVQHQPVHRVHRRVRPRGDARRTHLIRALRRHHRHPGELLRQPAADQRGRRLEAHAGDVRGSGDGTALSQTLAGGVAEVARRAPGRPRGSEAMPPLPGPARRRLRDPRRQRRVGRVKSWFKRVGWFKSPAPRIGDVHRLSHRTEVPQARVDRVRAQRAATAVRNQRRRLLRAADPESTRVYPRQCDRLRVFNRGGAAGGGEQDRENHRRGGSAARGAGRHRRVGRRTRDARGVESSDAGGTRVGAVDRGARDPGVQAELLREHGADPVRGECGGVPVGGEEHGRGCGRGGEGGYQRRRHRHVHPAGERARGDGDVGTVRGGGVRRVFRGACDAAGDAGTDVREHGGRCVARGSTSGSDSTRASFTWTSAFSEPSRWRIIASDIVAE